MAESRSIQKVLQDMLSTRAFHKLEEFSNKDSWLQLTSEEKELLALAFVTKAGDQIKVPRLPLSFEVKKSLNMAIDLAPMSAKVWYKRALAFATCDTEQDLLEAIR